MADNELNNMFKRMNLTWNDVNLNEQIVYDVDKLAVFTFGRFQPPHINHRKNLIEPLIKLAGNHLNNKNMPADAFVFTSKKDNKFNDGLLNKKYYNKYKKSLIFKEMKKHKQFCSFNLNENPLKIEDKLYYLKKLLTPKNKSSWEPERLITRKKQNIDSLIFMADNGVIFELVGNYKNIKTSSGRRINISSPFDAIRYLKNMGYEYIIFYVGEDRALGIL